MSNGNGNFSDYATARETGMNTSGTLAGAWGSYIAHLNKK